MKIVFISLFKRGFGGGEGRVAHEMARYFAAHYDVAMICPADRTGLFEGENGLKIFGIHSAGEGEVWVPALSGRIVSRLFDFLDQFQPDAVHAHEPTSVGLIGQVWAKMHLVPFVHTSHVLPSKFLEFGATDAMDVRILQSSLSESVTERMVLDFYNNCDAIIALNPPARDALRQFGYQGRLYMIPNGRDLQQYGKCLTADLNASRKVLTFIGYISARKNQAYLLEVLRHLPRDYELRLIGNPLKPQYKRELEAFCAEHDLDTVVFTGQVPHREIPSHLEQTHVFVSASKMEVQSLVVIEALASGTPVVGLSNETIDELVDNKVGRRLPRETEPEVFAQQIEHICNLPQTKYQQLCANARARVSRLDWSNVMAQTVNAYRELVEQAPSRTQEDEARLTDLVSFLPPGEMQDVLTDTIDAWEEERNREGRPRPLKSLLDKLRAAKRVPRSTWMLAGMTILVSGISYLFMKYLRSASRSRRSRRGRGR